MSVLAYNEITLRKYVVLDGAPYEVLDSHVFRKQMRKPVNQTKLRNMITGKVVEHAFHQAETAQEADISTKGIVYLYKKPSRQSGGMEYWFADAKDKSKRFQLDETIIGGTSRFMKENDEIEALIFTDDDDEERIIGIKTPIKITLRVTEAPPGTKGNTAQGGTKQVVVETGAVINTPLFINQGDMIVINTETGEYVERG